MCDELVAAIILLLLLIDSSKLGKLLSAACACISRQSGSGAQGLRLFNLLE